MPHQTKKRRRLSRKPQGPSFFKETGEKESSLIFIYAPATPHPNEKTVNVWFFPDVHLSLSPLPGSAEPDHWEQGDGTRETRTGAGGELHHPDTFTVGADPRWAIADTPLILFEAFLANLKATGTAPAELFFLFTAMTSIFA